MAKKKQPKNPLVVQSNLLIRRKKNTAGVYAMRLVATVAKRVGKDDTDFKDYEIPVVEILGEGYGGEQLAILRQSISAVGHYLYERETENGGWAMSGVFSYCEYLPAIATLVVRFDPSMKAHYLGLQGQFTEYSYEEFMLLPSAYSQKLFELLKSYQPQGTKLMEIDWLHDYLDTPEAYRKDFAMFRRKVLEQAYKDIVENENSSSLWFTWEPIRKGRGGKVTELLFIFNPITAEKTHDITEAKIRQKERSDKQKVISRAWDCWHEYRKKGLECVPKPRNERCKFCRERGGKYADSVGSDKSYEPLDGQLGIDFSQIVKSVD